MVVARGGSREYIPRRLVVVSACCLGVMILVGMMPVNADGAPRHGRATVREHGHAAKSVNSPHPSVGGVAKNGVHPALGKAAEATVTTSTRVVGFANF